MLTMIMYNKPPTDVASIEWNGEIVTATTRHGVTMALARKLVELGCPDQPWQARGLDGSLRLQGPSLFRLARWTIQENDTKGLTFERFKKAPDFRSGGAPEAE